jgi:hypothetical protein
LLYYGRQFVSSSTGAQLVEVLCDKCGFNYFYILARVGSGTSSSSYGIGSALAERWASESAERELSRRLECEAELVPCPQCHWINESLISGYRKSVCRGWDKVALVIGFGGTCASLVAARVFPGGPAGEHFSQTFLLVVCPAVSITLAGLVLLLRRHIRLRIQPNKGFPLAPKLPGGSPPALIRDPHTGLVEPYTKSNKES